MDLAELCSTARKTSSFRSSSLPIRLNHALRQLTENFHILLLPLAEFHRPIMAQRSVTAF